MRTPDVCQHNRRRLALPKPLREFTFTSVSILMLTSIGAKTVAFCNSIISPTISRNCRSLAS